MILEVKKYGLFKVKHYTVYFTVINIKFLSISKHAKLIVTSFQMSHRYDTPKISFTHTSLDLCIKSLCLSSPAPPRLVLNG